MLSTHLIPLVFLLAPQQSALPETLKAETLRVFSKELAESYVHQDVAKRINAEFAKWKLTPAYEQITDGEEFARQINTIMASQVTDGHLWIRYSANPLPPREEPRAMGKAERERENKIVRLTNAGFSMVERLSGNVGYLKINGFFNLKESRRPIEAAMKFLANTDSIILDLREHRGGESTTCDLFTSIFFDAKKPVKFSDLYDRKQGKSQEIWSSKNTFGLRYTKPVYVLISKATGSAGEAVAYNLQAYKRSISIGEPSFGIANMGNFFRVNDHFMSFVPYAQGRSPVTGTNWEKTGVIPDVKTSAADALKTAHILALEKIISSATDPEDKAALEAALARVKKD